MTYNAYRLLRTTDGGISWDSISTLPGSYYLDLRFLNDSVGFASGSNGKIMRTTDGGLKWKPTLTNSPEDIYTLHFANDSIGWAAGPGPWVLKSTDGGQSWRSVCCLSDLTRRKSIPSGTWGFLRGGTFV